MVTSSTSRYKRPRVLTVQETAVALAREEQRCRRRFVRPNGIPNFAKPALPVHYQDVPLPNGLPDRPTNGLAVAVSSLPCVVDLSYPGGGLEVSSSPLKAGSGD